MENKLLFGVFVCSSAWVRAILLPAISDKCHSLLTKGGDKIHGIDLVDDFTFILWRIF
jgi:hypothetical protein